MTYNSPTQSICGGVAVEGFTRYTAREFYIFLYCSLPILLYYGRFHHPAVMPTLSYSHIHRLLPPRQQAFVSPLTICSSGITRCNSSTRLGYRIGPLQSHNTQPRLRPVLRHPPNFSGSSLGWDGYKTVRRRTELGMVPKARASPQLTEDELSEMAAMREKVRSSLRKRCSPAAIVHMFSEASPASYGGWLSMVLPIHTEVQHHGERTRPNE